MLLVSATETSIRQTESSLVILKTCGDWSSIVSFVDLLKFAGMQR